MEIRYIKMVVEGVHSGDVLEIPTIRKRVVRPDTREFGITYTRNMTIKVSRIPQNYTKKLFEFDTYLQV
jgi:hypothetical protein